jgi:hypothetical protein
MDFKPQDVKKIVNALRESRLLEMRIERRG